MKRILGLDSTRASVALVLAFTAQLAAGCGTDDATSQVNDGLDGGNTGGSVSGSGGASSGGHTSSGGTGTASGGVGAGTGGVGSGGAPSTGGATGSGGSDDGGVEAGADGAASGGANNGSGGAASGGANNGSGGAASGGASNGSGGAAGGGGDAGPELDPGTGTVLAAGTDYGATGIVGVFRPGGDLLSQSDGFDGNSAIVASEGRAFLLERGFTGASVDRVHFLDGNGAVTGTIALDPPVADGGVAPWLDPSDVTVVGTKAYIPLYNANAIVVVDLDTKMVVRTIDVSSLVESGDLDGQLEVSHGFYDATSNRVYFLAERIDVTDFGVCQSVPAILFAVDPTTDTIVTSGGQSGADAGADASGAGEPVEINLQLVGPSDVSFDPALRRLLVTSAGCVVISDAGSHRVKHGVEAVDLANLTTSVVFHPTSQDYLSRLVVFSPTKGLIDANDENFGNHWHWLDLATGQLDAAEVAGVPSGVVADGPDTVVGMDFNFGQPTKIVRRRLTDGATAVLANVWSTAGYFASNGVVILK